MHLHTYYTQYNIYSHVAFTLKLQPSIGVFKVNECMLPKVAIYSINYVCLRSSTETIISVNFLYANHFSLFLIFIFVTNARSLFLYFYAYVDCYCLPEIKHHFVLENLPIYLSYIHIFLRQMYV